MENENLLHEAIESEFTKLEDLEAGSDAYKVTVDGLTKLMDRAIELEKIRANAEEKAKDRENEIKLKREQLAADKKDQLWKNSIAIGSIVLPVMVTIWGTFKTIKFEETGSITTIMGRGFVNKLLPKH